MPVSPMNFQLSPVLPPTYPEQEMDNKMEDKMDEHPNQPQMPPPPYNPEMQQMQQMQQMNAPMQLQQGVPMPMVVQTVQPATIFVHTGNCPRCHQGIIMETTNTCCLVMIIGCCILWFPIGLFYLCCLPSAKEHKCSHCGIQIN